MLAGALRSGVWEVKYKSLLGQDVTIDANVAIDLWELECLELLGAVFRTIYIPRLVLDTEIPHLASNLILLNPVQAEISSRRGWEFFRLLKCEFPALSEQDRLVMTTCYEIKTVCVSNDSGVRKACKSHRIQVTGLLGVLGCARIHSIISQDKLRTLIHKLTHTSCYISPNLINSFLPV